LSCALARVIAHGPVIEGAPQSAMSTERSAVL
jgi:hypothetical protein